MTTFPQQLIRKPSQRLFSFLTTLVFCLNQVFITPAPSAYAQSAFQAPVGIRSGTSSVSGVSFASAKVKEMTVPSGLGSIEEIHEASSGYTVILLQDAHDVPDAQKSLEQLVEYFQKEYGIKTVALEGIQGDLDQTLLRHFPDQKKLREVFNTYLGNGEISGAAAASVLSPYETRYTGLEDWDLYQQGISAFLKALSGQSEIQAVIQDKEIELAAQKEKSYSSQAKELDAVLEKWNRDYSSMENLLAFLRSIEIAGAGKYPMIDQMVQLQLKSREAYVGKAVREHAELERKIKSIDGQELMKEIGLYIDEIKNKILITEKERELDRRTEELRSLKKLSDFKLSIDDWRTSKAFWKKTPNLKGLELFLEFYDIAERRDRVFAQKLTALLKESLNKTVLFAGGGFHKAGIAQALKQQNISYVTVLPKIGDLPNEKLYLNHMQGRVSWADYFEVKDGRINLYEAFLRATMDQLLKRTEDLGLRTEQGLSVPSQLAVLKRWRDDLVKSLAAEKRIEQAASYTNYLDEYAKAQLTPEKLNEIRKQWEARLHQVIDQLKILEEKNQLTETNVARLLYSFSTVTYLAAGSFQSGLSIPAWWTGSQERAAVNIEPLRQSELRTVEEFKEAFEHQYDTELDLLASKDFFGAAFFNKEEHFRSFGTGAVAIEMDSDWQVFLTHLRDHADAISALEKILKRDSLGKSVVSSILLDFPGELKNLLEALVQNEDLFDAFADEERGVGIRLLRKLARNNAGHFVTLLEEIFESPEGFRALLNVPDLSQAQLTWLINETAVRGDSEDAEERSERFRLILLSAQQNAYFTSMTDSHEMIGQKLFEQLFEKDKALWTHVWLLLLWDVENFQKGQEILRNKLGTAKMQQLFTEAPDLYVLALIYLGRDAQGLESYVKDDHRVEVSRILQDTGVELGFSLSEPAGYYGLKGFLRMFGLNGERVSYQTRTDANDEAAARILPGLEPLGQKRPAKVSSVVFASNERATISPENAAVIPYFPLKYLADYSVLSQAARDQLRQAMQLPDDRQVIVASYIEGDEEKLFLKAYQALPEDNRPLLIMGSRNQVNDFRAFKGLNYAVRSPGDADGYAGNTPMGKTDVVILNTLGELYQFYALNGFALFGNDRNPFEPVVQGQRILFLATDELAVNGVATRFFESENVAVQITSKPGQTTRGIKAADLAAQMQEMLQASAGQAQTKAADAAIQKFHDELAPDYRLLFSYLIGGRVMERSRSELRSSDEVPAVTEAHELIAQRKRQDALIKLKEEFADDDYIEDFFYSLTENFPLEHLAAETVTPERLARQVAFAYEAVRAYQKDPQKNAKKLFLEPEGIAHTELFIVGKNRDGVRKDVGDAIHAAGMVSESNYARKIMLPATSENPEIEIGIWIFEISKQEEGGQRALSAREQFRVSNQIEKIYQENIRKGQIEAHVRGRASMPNALRRGHVAYLKPFAEKIGINDVVTDIFAGLRGQLTNGKLGAAIKQRREEDWEKFSNTFDDFIAREKGLVEEASPIGGPRDFIEKTLSLSWWAVKKLWNLILRGLARVTGWRRLLKLQLSAPARLPKISLQDREAALAALAYIQALKSETFTASWRPIEGVLPYYGGARSIFEGVAAEHIKTEKQLEAMGDESEKRQARKMKELLNELIRELHSDFRIWGVSSKFREGQYDEAYQRKLLEDEIQRFKTALEKVIGFKVVLNGAGAAQVADDYDQVDNLVIAMANKIVRSMEEDNRVAERAIALSVNPYVQGLRASGIEKQITNAREANRIFLRVLLALREGGVTASDVRVTETGGNKILFARDLDPYQLRDLLEEYPDISAIVTDQGSPNAHWVEKARNRGIPVLILDSTDKTLKDPISEVFTGKEVLLWKNAEGQPEMVVNPGEEVLKAYGVQESKQNALDQMARNHLNEKAVTVDGQEVVFYATADDADEVQKAFENGAEGIGLVRTEYLFGRNNPFLQNYIQNPGPETRRALVEDLQRRFEEMAILTTRGPLTLRAPDNARDKPLAVNNADKKYGIEYYLESTEGQAILGIFLEAAMRAQSSENVPQKHEIRILFPMDFVSEDIMSFLGRENLKDLTEDELERLQARNRDFINMALETFQETRQRLSIEFRRMENPEKVSKLDTMKRGFMVESQEGRALLDEIIEAGDFINYGMNDLTLSIFRQLNISRDNESDAQYGELRPEVFKAVREDLEYLRRRASTGDKIVPLCFCGTWPGMPEAILAMNGEVSEKIDFKLSIPSVLIPASKQQVRYTGPADRDLGVDDLALKTNPRLLHERAAEKVEAIRERIRQTEEYREVLKNLEGPEMQKGVSGGIEGDFSPDSTDVTRTFRVTPALGIHMMPMILFFKAVQQHPAVKVTLTRSSDQNVYEFDAEKNPVVNMDQYSTGPNYVLVQIQIQGEGAGLVMQAVQNIREVEGLEEGLFVFENPALKDIFDSFVKPAENPLFEMDEFNLELGRARISFDMGLIGRWRKLSQNGDDTTDDYRKAKRHFSDIYFLTQTDELADFKPGDTYDLALTGIDGEWGLRLVSVDDDGNKVFEVFKRSELRSEALFEPVLADLLSRGRVSRTELRKFSNWLSVSGVDGFGRSALSWLKNDRNLSRLLWNPADAAEETAPEPIVSTEQMQVQADAILQAVRENQNRNLWIRLSDRDIQALQDLNEDSESYQFLETLTTLARNGRTVSIMTASDEDRRNTGQAIDRFFNTVYGPGHRDQWRPLRGRIQVISLSEISAYHGTAHQIDFVTDLEEAQLINAAENTAEEFERLIVSDFVRENGQLSFLGASLLEKTRLLLEAATGAAGATGLYAESGTSRIHFADSSILTGISDLLSVLNQGNRALLASA
ncbi:MAG: hypothetical protein H6757_06080 [Candidatus Omnitrophica bacterium]|nr:hypothetical protein [Candidatus Omnitrophota bacterium]